MVRIENDCVGCDDLTCSGCQLPHSRHFYCDCCDKECDPLSSDPKNWLFDLDGDELCWVCLLDAANITKVE